jgi:hypothetical protein
VSLGLAGRRLPPELAGFPVPGRRRPAALALRPDAGTIPDSPTPSRKGRGFG